MAAESTIHPNYDQDIQYGCISLDERGVEAWGNCHFFFKDLLVVHRAAEFEENPVHFNRRHGGVAGGRPPAGYRATWPAQDKLALAKLHPKIQKSTKAIYFPGILLKQGSSTGDMCVEPLTEASYEPGEMRTSKPAPRL